MLAARAVRRLDLTSCYREPTGLAEGHIPLLSGPIIPLWTDRQADG
jgi:hypothetical protein